MHNWLINNSAMSNESNNKTHNVNKITLHDTTLYYFINNENNDYNINNTKLLIKRCDIINNIAKSVPKSLEIFCFPSDIKRNLLQKEFKNIDDELATLENNSLALTISGQTFSHKHSSKIFITRKEELTKILYHELIHFYNLELHNNANENHFAGDKIEKVISKWYVDKNNHSGGCYEAFVEFLSNVFHVCTIAIELSLKNNKPYDEKILLDILQIETLYSIYATAKLLHLFGYNDTNFMSFFNRDDFNKNIIPLKTNISSLYYYIVRSMLLFSINKIFTNEYIDPNTFHIKKQYINMEKKIIETQNDEYMKILKDAFLLVKNNDDMSLSYICLDVDPNKLNVINEYVIENNQIGGHKYKHKYLKYKHNYLRLKNLQKT